MTCINIYLREYMTHCCLVCVPELTDYVQTYIHVYRPNPAITLTGYLYIIHPLICMSHTGLVVILFVFLTIQRKCESYWPVGMGQEERYGDFTLRTISCESYTNYTLRVFHLIKDVRLLYIMLLFFPPFHNIK